MKPKFTRSMSLAAAANKKPAKKNQFLHALTLIIFSGLITTGYAQTTNTKPVKLSPAQNLNALQPNGPWFTKGNFGTDPSKNFIGTLDAQSLFFRVNNQKAGYIDYSEYNLNTAFGYHTLNANVVSDSGGRFTTAFGAGALSSNTTGWGNTAHGADALFSNTTGSINTAVGGEVLISNTTG